MLNRGALNRGVLTRLRAHRSTGRVPAAVRRRLARHPALWWLIVATITAAVTWSVHRRLAAVDATRSAWGATATVYVADAPAAPGDPIRARPQEVPRALAPPGALDEIDGATTARQHVGTGEIVTRDDVTGTGPLALAPPGWRVVVITEQPRSGAAVGDRVDVTTEGIVLHAGAIVVGDHDGSTLVAVPADVAPLAALANEERGVSLLRVP